jgi:hypothetical protein
VEFAVGAEQPAPAGLWRSIYDVFLYLEGRDELQGPNAPGRYRFNPGTELKRLFLLGGIAAYAETAVIPKEVGTRLREWAEGAELNRGESRLSETRFLRVDVARDEPPFWGTQAVSGAYSGWILEVPRSMSDYLHSIEPKACQQSEGA